MAEAAVSFLLESLQKVLAEQILVISAAESELYNLQEELGVLKDFLEASAEKGKAWIQFERDITELVYDVEDIIDAYAYLTQLSVGQNSTSSCLRRMSRIPRRRKLRKPLKALREEQLRPLLDRVRKAASADASAPSAQHQQDAQLPLVRQDEVVGLKDETDKLINNLVEESLELRVIPIYGMGGLGKTTLARIVYDDARVQREFDCSMWVSVSQDYNEKRLLLTILKQFAVEDMSDLSDSLLAEIVRNNLENRRFLLVIDDVHTIDSWRVIEVALPKSNRFGKVIITTQNEQLAREANHKRDLHCKRLLTYQESWELLQLKVFGKLDECPPKLEELGKQIAMNCQGLPLAIVTIARILYEKNKLSTGDMIEEWEEVLSTLSTYLENDYENRMENIIALRYNKLPSKLKSCFLYLAAFPKDTAISTWKLIHLWIAEGFIQQNLGKSLEEAAEENLKHLIDRNLVMVDKTKAGGGVKTCRLHYIAHEFCTRQASRAVYNLFQEVKRSSDGAFNPPVSEIPNCRRLCIHSYVEDFLCQKPKGRRVRSFLCSSKEAIILQPDHVSAITEAFDGLRVLDVNPIKFSKFPSKIARLIHLRYISLSVDNFNTLPAAVFKLWNLQTIRIDTMLRTFEIKADIWKTNSLRHLKTKAAIVMNQEAKGRAGENLQTFNRLSTKSFSEEICKRASNLKSLGIRGNLTTLLNTKHMARLDRLQKLKLLHDVFPRTTSENPLIHLPRLEAFPPNMTILTLSSTFLEWEHMGTLGMLPTLEILKLKDNAFVGMFWKVDDGSFPSLEVLLIEHTNLTVWSASEDSFPTLKCLVLKNCEKLNEIPRVLMKSLQALDIERVSESAVNSAKRIQEEKLKRGEFKLCIWPGVDAI